jgi:hypothetical protein
MEEGGYYFTANLDDDTRLFLSPLTDEEAIAAGRSDYDTSGYFLYEKSASNPTSINILARIDGDDAAFALSRMLKMK